MADRYSYEFKTFRSGARRGKVYVNKRSIKTGKVVSTFSKASKVKNARNTVRAQIRRAEDREIDEELRKIAKKYHGNYGDLREDYNKLIKIERLNERKRIIRERKAGKKPSGRKSKTLKQSVHDKLKRNIGYVTTYRFVWVVRERFGGRWDSPYIAAQRADSYPGDQFDKVKAYVKEISDPIIDRDKEDVDFMIMPNTPSGACVRLIDRETDESDRKYGLGKVGCDPFLF